MKTYDPKSVQVIIGGVPIAGFMDGTFVSVKRNADAFSMTVGTDGEGTRVKSNDKSGTIEITLAQSSISNEYLSSLLIADEVSNGGLVPAMVKDGSGRSLHVAEQAYVKKHPDSDHSKSVEGRVYIIETDNLEMFNGGN